jgi:hypothetical protein
MGREERANAEERARDEALEQTPPIVPPVDDVLGRRNGGGRQG